MSLTWQISTVERVGDLTKPSLAFTPSGQAIIAFFSSNAQALRFGALDSGGNWTISNVDTVSDECFPSLALRSGCPAISYGVSSAQELRYALYRGGNPAWSIQSVTQGGSTSSLAFNSIQRAGISYFEPGTQNAPIRLSEFDIHLARRIRRWPAECRLL